MTYWTNRRVLVTGGAGFLGSHLVRKLRERGALVSAPGRDEYDLRHREMCEAVLRDETPETIVHLAAVVGGIGANRAEPGRFFFENAIMGIQLIEEARKFWDSTPEHFEGRKFACLGTVCAYPRLTPVPFREEDLWSGYPEETNAPYGLAKKMLLVQLQAYKEEYGFPGVYLLPVNLFGPGDNFDLETGHVIPSMIRKFIEARESRSSSVVLWGDGSPTREFLYVEDAAEGILAASERLEDPRPVNLGSSREISMKDLAETIRGLTAYGGEVVWDSSRPNGQPRRKLDVSKAEALFGWKASTPFEEGLKKTIESYQQMTSDES